MTRQAVPSPAVPVRILHLEDSVLDAELVAEYLRADGMTCRIDRVMTRGDFAGALERGGYDLIVADYQLPDFDGLSALEIARHLSPEVPFIFLSGALGEEIAIDAVRRGATDYAVKQRIDRLPAVIRRALAEVAERADRRRAEAALRTSEQNFAALVDAMPQLCWIADSAGAVTWYNRRWHEYTGTSHADTAGWGWQRVHDPAVLPRVLERWSASIVTGVPFEMIFPLRGADGRFRAFLTRAHPVKDGVGRVVRWLGTCTDVSTQQEAEEALRRLNETLEQRVVDAIVEREAILAKLHDTQKLEMIGQLTGGVAHDFNNLLTPIVGSLEVLSRRSGLDDRARRLTEGALQAAERAKVLVQRLLAFAGRQMLEPTAVDIPALVEGVRDLIQRSIGAGIDFAIEGAPDLPKARVDPNQLELALLNLAVNARDAMPDGGRLRIAVDRQRVEAGDDRGLRHGDYVRLSVIDTGTGMDAETLRRSIEPFYSTKGVGKGTGLGLSMVHGLAAQSGGALRLDSAPDAGTRAEIWLPIANGAGNGAGAAAGEAAPAASRLAILLVDDDPLVRTMIDDMLSDLGHSVVQAASAPRALDLVEAGPMPDLVITDYLMPGMNGADLARAIRTRHPRLPVIIATGYASLAGNAMADLPLLTKPFQQSELAALIGRLVAERPAGGGMAAGAAASPVRA
ncbi:MAG: response regulator [Alphaproteobacteria bacterium]